MTKTALLIGVSDYQPGFDSLPGTQTDIRTMERVLQHPEMGGFDEVRLLPNPDKGEMELAIEKLLADRQRDDLVLLYFSGHGFKDDDGSLYFVTHTTEQRSPQQIYQSTAVSASVLQGWMSRSRCKRQVLVLDCCFSGAFAEGMKAKAVNETVDINAQFGGEGRAVLTSSTALQYSFEQQEASIYTRYLVEGIESGAADTDSNGVITIDELHDYAKRKVQEAAPAMKPEIYAVKEGYTIVLAQAPLGDPKLEYRKEVEQWAKQRNGKLSPIVLRALDEKRRTLRLSPEEIDIIQSEVLRPYREFEEKLQRYEQELTEAQQHESPLSEETREDLQYFQQVLGLRGEDVAAIETRLVPKIQLSQPRSPQPRAAERTQTPPATTESFEPVQLLQAPTTNPGPARRNNKPLIWGGAAGAGILVLGISLSALHTPSPWPSGSPPPSPKNSQLSVSPSASPTKTSASPVTAEDFLKLAIDEHSKGKYESAIYNYTQAIDIRPDSVAYYGRGLGRHNSNDKQGAIQDYTKAIQGNQNWGAFKPGYYGLPSAYYYLGVAHYSSGNYQAAIGAYSQAINFKPDFADAYYGRGSACFVLNNKQGAIDDYKRAANLYSQQRNTEWYQKALEQIGALQKR